MLPSGQPKISNDPLLMTLLTVRIEQIRLLFRGNKHVLEIPNASGYAGLLSDRLKDHLRINMYKWMTGSSP